MAKLKFKDENNNFISVVQDIKINNNSVFDGKEADINLKTINNTPIVGNGNISIDQDFVKDNNYVHTDNNYTTAEKDKLSELENYDDTEIKQDITDLDDNKADKSEIPDVSNFITKSVDDLINYYKKSETFTKQEVNDLISAITTMDLQVVQTLPTEDISTTTIYLVPKTTAETNNAYDEYIYVSNNWEFIGSTEVDLTDYVKNTDYASSSKGGVVKVDETSFGIGISGIGKLLTRNETYANYLLKDVYFAISKGTLENVITGKELVNKTYVDNIVGDIETLLAEV